MKCLLKMCLIFMDKITVFFSFIKIYKNGTRQRYINSLTFARTCYFPILERIYGGLWDDVDVELWDKN